MATLDQAVEDILTEIVESITAETDATGSLSEVVSVVRGDRARPMPALPAVWVVPQSAKFVQAEFGEQEEWFMPVSIAALVKDDNPDTGGRLAQSITARARAAALNSRPAGVAVIDVRSDTFDPTARSSEQNRTLFWTEATIRVTFTVDE